MSNLLLEVIVTSVADAVEAAIGGADRLELVAELEHGGLTPSIDLARQVVERVSIPVRVMVRESRHMSVESLAEVQRLKAAAKLLSELRVDGLVTGFLKDGALDLEITGEVLACAPKLRATFHRASDHVHDTQHRIDTLKHIPQIDRVLTNGGSGSWDKRKGRLECWRDVCAPEIQIIFAAGNEIAHAGELIHGSRIMEVHVGRAARTPHSAAGAVNRDLVAALRNTLTVPR